MQSQILSNLVIYFYLCLLLFLFQNLVRYVLDVKYRYSQIKAVLFLLLSYYPIFLFYYVADNVDIVSIRVGKLRYSIDYYYSRFVTVRSMACSKMMFCCYNLLIGLYLVDFSYSCSSVIPLNLLERF